MKIISVKKINEETYIVFQDNAVITYHCKERIEDPYNIFKEYHDTFFGIDYKVQGLKVGVMEVEERDITHTVIGVIDKFGVLVSPLLDLNTSNEYGVPYMDPSLFEEAIDDIKRDMIEEIEVISQQRIKRAKVNMRIMKSKNLTING